MKRIFLILLAIVACLPVQAAITRVQIFHNASFPNTGTTVPCTFSAITNGDTLILAIATKSVSVSSISQSGCSYSQLAGGTIGTQHVEFWIAYNVSSASTSCTITMSGTNTNTGVIGMEYSGLATSAALDKTANNNGSTTAFDGGTTATTTRAVELWLTAFYCNDGGQDGAQTMSAATNGYSIASQYTDNLQYGMAVCEKIVSSTGTAGCGVTNTFAATNSGLSVAILSPASGNYPSLPLAGAGGCFYLH